MTRVLKFGVSPGLAFALALTLPPSCAGHAEQAAQSPQPGASPDSIRQTALALEQQGKNADAASEWRAFLRTHPADPEPYAHLGLLAARQEHYKEAVPLYRKALAINPSTESVQRNLGLALFKSGDLRGAAQEFSLLLKSHPGDFQLTTLIGMSYYGLAEYKKAAPYLREAAQRDPQSLPLRLALAHSCMWSKQFQCVMDTYHEILALNAESAEADMLAGEALDELKDNEGSTKMFRAAVAANPKEPNAHFGLGYLLWSQKQYPEAAQEFEAELANDPNHVQAMEYLADSNIQMNRMDAAKPLLQKVNKLNPSLALVHLDLGIVYTEADQKPEALRELTAAEKLDPKEVNVHWRLGRLYRSMGRKDEAIAEFDKANALNKAQDDENYRRIAAQGNAWHGDKGAASAAQQPAPTTDPPNPPAANPPNQ